jgi:hypothetical protein
MKPSWIILVVAVGCTSAKHRAFEKVAREANPIFTALRPKVARILSLRNDPPAEVEACLGADAELQALRDVRFDAEGVDSEPKHARVSDYARWLTVERIKDCTPDMIRLCYRECMSNWQALIDAVRRLHDAAAAESVEIIPLVDEPGASPPPPPPPQP